MKGGAWFLDGKKKEGKISRSKLSHVRGEGACITIYAYMKIVQSLKIICTGLWLPTNQEIGR